MSADKPPYQLKQCEYNQYYNKEVRFIYFVLLCLDGIGYPAKSQFLAGYFIAFTGKVVVVNIFLLVVRTRIGIACGSGYFCLLYTSDAADE